MRIALTALVVLGIGCASGGDKRHPAQVRVDAVRGVLAEMSAALDAGDAERLTGMWREDRRDEARERVAHGLRQGVARQVKFTLLGVRVAGDRLDARITWEGTRGDEAVAGTFMLGLDEGPPVQVVEVSGSDPVSGGAAQVDVPAGGLR
ncbi:MAG: hypothetical protein OEY97_06460 [Nitrospirota bacterium]|nr:hypothetical protein [Nitrospirota bacterium]